MTFALVVTCGKPPEDDSATPVPAAAGDPGAEVDLNLELPPAFPSSFPIPPLSTVIEATAVPGPGGVVSQITLVTPEDEGDVVAWFERALVDSGWEITDREIDGSRRIHAIRGESYVDLEVAPPTAAAGDSLRIHARIWNPAR